MKKKKCATCHNNVENPHFTQCESCINQGIDIEDHKAAESILSRVLAGLCQCCGKKPPCNCNFVA